MEFASSKSETACDDLRPILARKNMTQTRAPPAAAQGAWSALQAFAQTSDLQNQALVASDAPKNVKIVSSW
jgi:hypothetical protein